MPNFYIENIYSTHFFRFLFILMLFLLSLALTKFMNSSFFSQDLTNSKNFEASAWHIWILATKHCLPFLKISRQLVLSWYLSYDMHLQCAMVNWVYQVSSNQGIHWTSLWTDCPAFSVGQQRCIFLIFHILKICMYIMSKLNLGFYKNLFVFYLHSAHKTEMKFYIQILVCLHIDCHKRWRCTLLVV